MSGYHDSRAELQKLIESEFKKTAQAENAYTPELDKMFNAQSERLLDTFEGFIKAANAPPPFPKDHGFLYGVWQGLVASVVFVLLIGIGVPLFRFGTGQDPVKILRDALGAGEAAPTPTPSPTPPPLSSLSPSPGQ